MRVFEKNFLDMPLYGRSSFTYKDTHIPMQTGAVINVTLQGCTDF
jgi:hypothetical protein